MEKTKLLPSRWPSIAISSLFLLFFSCCNLNAQNGTSIGLKASNGQYLCAEGGGGQVIIANRPALGPWETFILEELGNNQVALKASNGQYWCAEGGGGQVINANRTARGAWETFTIERLGNNQLALRANNGQYLCAEGGGGQAILANRPARGAWETFTMETVGGNAASSTSTPRPSQAVPDADMCWAASQPRGAGTFPTDCGPGQEYDAGLCYPKCEAGYVGVGPVCWRSCPAGYRDDGAFCAKPAPYGRGAGYAWKFGDGFDLSSAKARCEKDNPQGCEQSGLIMYPKCNPGFHAVGCCVCSPDCPAGFTDIGVSCAKPSYGRGAGTIPKNCANGKEYQAGLCYTPCGAGFHGIGPVCWANECPNVFPIRCAAGCARSSADCFNAVVNQVITPLEMVANIAGIVMTGGSSAVAKSAAKTSAKTIAKESIKSQLIRKAKEMGKNLAEDAAENAATTFYEAQLTGEFSWEDLDPTGIANVVKAFNKPLCKDIH
jgi:Fascin domain